MWHPLNRISRTADFAHVWSWPTAHTFKALVGKDYQPETITHTMEATIANNQFHVGESKL